MFPKMNDYSNSLKCSYAKNNFSCCFFIKMHYLYVTLPLNIQDSVRRNPKMYRNILKGNVQVGDKWDSLCAWLR